MSIEIRQFLHAIALPRVGGIGIVLGTVFSLILWYEIDYTLWVFFISIAMLSIFGILDDRYNLNYILKLSGQLSAVLIIVICDNYAIKDIFGFYSIPNYIGYPLTVLFLLGTTNAMNLSDGLDGLAAGLSLLSLAFIAYLAFLADANTVVAICIAIIGSTLGFLRYNTHPALAFMGDTGSQFLGFTIGLLLISLTQKNNTALSGVLPLFIIGLPVVDAIRVMVERISSNLSPFKADRNHFHHKLLVMGFDHYESVLVIYIVQALFILIAFLCRYESDFLLLSIYIILSFVICLIFPISRSLQWHRRLLPLGQQSILTNIFNNLYEKLYVERSIYVILSIMLPIIIFLGIILNPIAKTDISLFSVILLLAWIFSHFLKLAVLDVIMRIAMYYCVTLVIYSIAVNGLLQSEFEQYFNYSVAMLALLVAVGVVFSPRHFSITPSDYLVMFMLVISARLPVNGGINYAKHAVQGAIVFYALEYVLRYPGIGGNALRGTCLLVLATVSFRGFITIMRFHFNN